MKNYLLDFLSLVYPRCCISCQGLLNASEEHLCLFCLVDLPITSFADITDNPVEKVFHGRLEIKSASSYLHFKKGNKTQSLLHELKYRNNPELGKYLGKLMGLEVKQSNRFKNIDAIVPIPLHKSKLKKRGYNQSELLAIGISHEIEADVHTDLISKSHDSTSQTDKNRLQRWENVSNIFRVNKTPNRNFKHILVVDDVITTGATIESFVNKLRLAIDAEISVVSLAFTD